MLGRRKMRDGFHNAPVNSKCVFQELFPVSGDGGGADPNIGMIVIQPQQIFPDDRDRVAGIALIHRIEDLPVLAEQHGFDGGGTRIDAQIGLPLIGGDVAPRRFARLVTLTESLIFLFVVEQRLNGEERRFCSVISNIL